MLYGLIVESMSSRCTDASASKLATCVFHTLDDQGVTTVENEKGVFARCYANIADMLATRTYPTGQLYRPA